LIFYKNESFHAVSKRCEQHRLVGKCARKIRPDMAAVCRGGYHERRTLAIIHVTENRRRILHTFTLARSTPKCSVCDVTCRQWGREVDCRLVDVIADVVRSRSHRRKSSAGEHVVAGAVSNITQPRRTATDETPCPTVRLAANRRFPVCALDPERRRQLEVGTAGHYKCHV